MIILSVPANKIHLINRADYPDTYLEYRLDHLKNVALGDFYEINNKTILTWKNVSLDDELLRKELFVNCVKKYNCLIDIELSNYQKYQELNENMILSEHLDIFNQDLIQETLQAFNKFDAKIYKLAIKIDNYKDLITLRNFSRSFHKPLIILSTGKLGKLSRILYKLLNSYGTYICLTNYPTAENQLTDQEFQKYKVKDINIDTKLTGLLGSTQVYQSKGMSFYNEIYYQNDINARYLPFYAEDTDDFKLFLEEYKKNIYGLSITMPFKKALTNQEPINLYLPHSNKYYNSDLLAFQRIFKEIHLEYQDPILIIGSGATAETALMALSNYQNTFLLARNQGQIAVLHKNYSVKTYTQSKIRLIINCTPLGLNNENLKDTFEIPDSDLLIDLPYSEKQTPLVRDYLQQGKMVFDGHTFWQYQSEFQKEMFLMEF